MKFSRTDIATFIAILFHISGWIGIAFTPYKNWFIANTPLNLCLMAALLVWNQPKKNGAFFLFFSICFLIGMSVEMIGVHTGRLFGHYSYGAAMGKKLNGVPWLIGINWFVIIFCSASCMQQFHNWLFRKISASSMGLPPALTTGSLIVDGAVLATLFDWVMEPAASKLDLWFWQTETVPFYNYTCWFLISVLLLAVCRKLCSGPVNHFAVHLFIIQVLFFLAIRTILL